jgi:hypothetical protein
MGLFILALFVPVGLLLPVIFQAETAWGEWGAEELRGLVGYVPARLAALAERWHAPMPDYAFSGPGGGLGHLSVAYIFSALVGGGLVTLVAVGLGRALLRGKRG